MENPKESLIKWNNKIHLFIYHFSKHIESLYYIYIQF